MAKLSIYHKLSFRASTLVEVLIALVILLSVFGAGMLLFSRLVDASLGKRQLQVRWELKELGAAYMDKTVEAHETRTTLAASYAIDVRPMEEYSDRKRVVFYAYDIETEGLMDSLILILPHDGNEDTL